MLSSKLFPTITFSVFLFTSAIDCYGAEPLKLSLGGKMEQYFFIINPEKLPDENINSSGSLSDVEIYFSGKSILDNGLQISARIELRAENQNNGEADEQYLDLISALGHIRIGQSEGFNHSLSYETPYITYEDDEIIGFVVPRRTSIVVKDILTFERFTGDAFQLGYETPKVFGFTLATNYFPKPQNNNEGFIDNKNGDKNAWEISANWESWISGNKYGLVAGYFKSHSGTESNDGEQAINISGQAELGNLTIGGSYISSKPSNNLNSSAYGLSSNYRIDRWGIGTSYIFAKKRNNNTLLVNDKLYQSKLEFSYVLLKGVKLGLASFLSLQKISDDQKFKDYGIISAISLRF